MGVSQAPGVEPAHTQGRPGQGEDYFLAHAVVIGLVAFTKAELLLHAKPAFPELHGGEAGVVPAMSAFSGDHATLMRGSILVRSCAALRAAPAKRTPALAD